MTRELSRLGAGLQTRLKRFFESPLGPDAKPLEIRQAVLDDVERKAEPVGRGRRVFPYDRIDVHVAGVAAGRPALEAAFRGLDAEVRERLEELRCGAPKGLLVTVSSPERTPVDWIDGQLFSIEYHRDAQAEPEQVEPSSPRTLRVTVVKGAASQEAFTFADRVIAIGRTAEPIDDLGRVRRNDVVFLDAVDGATETVGRAHARLTFDATRREYRLFDEGSSNGTAIIRRGTTIRVPAHDPRGVRVDSGDEIRLGRAMIRVSID